MRELKYQIFMISKYILKYLEKDKNIKLFLIDDISNIFSLLLKKLPMNYH